MSVKARIDTIFDTERKRNIVLSISVITLLIAAGLIGYFGQFAVYALVGNPAAAMLITLAVVTVFTLVGFVKCAYQVMLWSTEI